MMGEKLTLPHNLSIFIQFLLQKWLRKVRNIDLRQDSIDLEDIKQFPGQNYFVTVIKIDET